MEKYYAERPWKKYFTNQDQLNYPNVTVYDLVAQSAEKNSKATAYEFYEKQITYEKMIYDIDRTAAALLNIGVKPGNIVTICMANCPEAIQVVYALNKIGAVADIIHPGLSQNEIRRCLVKNNSTLIFVSDSQWAKVSAIVDKTDIRIAVVCDDSEMMPIVFKLHYNLKNLLRMPFIDNGYVKWQEFMNYADDDYEYINGETENQEQEETDNSNLDKSEIISEDVSENDSSSEEEEQEIFDPEIDDIVSANQGNVGSDIAIILHSGGTTGVPKGIMLTNANIVALTVQSVDLVDCFGPGSKVLAILPVFHGFGLVFCVHNFLANGGTVVLVSKFKPELFEFYLLKHKPNIIAGVPTLFRGLITNLMPGIDLSFVKMMVCGGDNMPDDLRDSIYEYFNKHNCDIEIREGYGLTECVAGVTIVPPGRHLEGEGSVGIAYKDMDLRVVDMKTGETVPVGEPGELLIAGPTVMKGYYKRPKENSKVFSFSEGKKWLHTGDVVSMDENGFIFFKQRLKRMIITSGYNVYPSYIEAIMCKNPYVSECAVIDAPHPYKGEVAVAYVVLEKGLVPTEKLKLALLRYCKKNLPFYSVPAKFIFLSELPKTAVGKIDHKKLK